MDEVWIVRRALLLTFESFFGRLGTKIATCLSNWKNILVMSWFQTKLYKSGTEKYPSPRHLALSMMEEMIGKKRWSQVTFRLPNSEESDNAAFIEVSDQDGSLKINVAYTSAENYQQYFERCGFELPAEWRVQQFEPNRGFMRDGSMLLSAPRFNPARVADFISDAFPKIYGSGNDFVLEGYFQ